MPKTQASRAAHWTQEGKWAAKRVDGVWVRALNPGRFFIVKPKGKGGVLASYCRDDGIAYFETIEDAKAHADSAMALPSWAKSLAEGAK